jgi:hypothetical protein
MVKLDDDLRGEVRDAIEDDETGSTREEVGGTKENPCAADTRHMSAVDFMMLILQISR